MLSLPLVRGGANKKNLLRHEYLTLAALVLHTAVIFLVMVPSLAAGFTGVFGFSVLDAVIVWSHVVLGSAAEVLALAIIVPWLYKHPSTMFCAPLRRWMLPTLIIWVIAILNGAAIHL